MNLTELHNLIGRYLSLKPQCGDTSVAVIVERPGSIGPTPATPVVSASVGIDWDNGSFLIKTSDPLTLLSPEDVQDIRQSVRKGGSWHAFQTYQRLQGEIDSLRAQLKTALEKQTPAEPPPSATLQIFAEWSSAYAAFKGAFDTPLSRRRDESEYAKDARDRLRELDESMRAMAPMLEEQERPPLEQYDLEQSAEYRKGYEDGRIKGYKVGYRHAQEHATLSSTSGAPGTEDGAHVVEPAAEPVGAGAGNLRKQAAHLMAQLGTNRPRRALDLVAVQHLLEQVAAPADVDKLIAELIRMAWEWGTSCEVDGVRWGEAGDSHNQMLRDRVQEAATRVQAFSALSGASRRT